MTLSPRQIFAWLDLSEKIDRVDRFHDLKNTFIGAQGDEKTIKGTMKDMIKEIEG